MSFRMYELTLHAQVLFSKLATKENIKEVLKGVYRCVGGEPAISHLYCMSLMRCMWAYHMEAKEL